MLGNGVGKWGVVWAVTKRPKTRGDVVKAEDSALVKAEGPQPEAAP